ncbi:hypothetical protein KR009_006288 [Drosophila setifemur]|nr:hypothetical protein KR009_006288 [Drosophila setifemur]
MARIEQRRLKAGRDIRIYTVGELIMGLKAAILTKSVSDVLYWQRPMVSVLWLIIGLFTINMLARYTLLSLVGMVGLQLLVHATVYMALRRHIKFQPYEDFLARPNLLKLSSETVNRLANAVTDSINRSVATFQYLLFGQHLTVSVVLLLAILEIRAFACMEFTTFFMITYSLSFVIPKLLSEANIRFNRFLLKLPMCPAQMVLFVMVMCMEQLYQTIRNKSETEEQEATKPQDQRGEDEEFHLKERGGEGEECEECKASRKPINQWKSVVRRHPEVFRRTRRADTSPVTRNI